MKILQLWMVWALALALAGCATLRGEKDARDVAAALVETSGAISGEVRTAADAERMSAALIEHYLVQATRSRSKRRSGELGALLLSTGSLIAIGMNWRSDLAIAAGFGGSALRQYLTIDQPRGPTPWLSAVNQTACIVAQLPPLIEYDRAFPTVAERQQVPQLDRLYNNAISSVRNGLWVIYANYQASTGDSSVTVESLPSHIPPQVIDASTQMAADEQMQLAVRMSSTLAQISTCPRLVVNAGY
jgi:hypothetical protein